MERLSLVCAAGSGLLLITGSVVGSALARADSINCTGSEFKAKQRRSIPQKMPRIEKSFCSLYFPCNKRRYALGTTGYASRATSRLLPIYRIPLLRFSAYGSVPYVLRRSQAEIHR